MFSHIILLLYTFWSTVFLQFIEFWNWVIHIVLTILNFLFKFFKPIYYLEYVVGGDMKEREGTMWREL